MRRQEKIKKEKKIHKRHNPNKDILRYDSQKMGDYIYYAVI